MQPRSLVARAARSEPFLAAVLLLAYGWLFVFFPRINNPNELVRVYMARAIAEHGTYAIGMRVADRGQLYDRGPVYADWGYVNDKALVCDDPRARPPACTGKLYAAKAPGISLLAAPIVAVARAVVHADAHREPTRGELVFALRWALGIAPSILLWLAVRRFLLRAGASLELAAVAALAGGCGSLSLTYGQMVAGHQPGAVALGVSFLAAFWPAASSTASSSTAAGAAVPDSQAARAASSPMRPGVPQPSAAARFDHAGRALLVGLGAGGAVCIEYPCAPAALLIAAGFLLFARPTLRAVAFAAAGAVPPLLLLAHFHAAAFGAPWSTPYSHLENPGFVRDLAPGIMGISVPTWERVWGSLLSPFLGLFYWSPWIALAPAAAALLVQATRAWVHAGAPSSTALDSTGAPRAPATAQPGSLEGSIAPIAAHPELAAGLTACAVVAYYLLFQITQALWRSGWTVGPRYITPIAPFAAIAIALALKTLREDLQPFALAIFGGSAAAGIAATGLASAVCQGFPLEVYNPLVEVVWPLLAHGYMARNPLQLLGVPGAWSALPSLAALALAIGLCILASAVPDLGRPRMRACVALALFAALTLAQWTATQGDANDHMGAVRYLANAWEPAPPPGAQPFVPLEHAPLNPH